MSDWFVQGPDGDIGPFRPSELLQLVRIGKVKPETQVRKGDSAWFEASSVGGLFEAAMRPTIEYLCPGCGIPVREPPCTCAECGREIHRAKLRITENTIVGEDDGGRPSQAGRSVQRWLKKVRGKREE